MLAAIRSKVPLDRRAYVLAALPLLALEYAAAFLPGIVDKHPVNGILAGRWMEWLVRGEGLEGVTLGLAVLACTSAIGWLSLRRAEATGQGNAAVCFAVVPWLQLVAIPMLARGQSSRDGQNVRSRAVLKGALWGLAIAFAAEIVFTLIFGNYGIALFVGAPFFVGLVAAYVAEREGPPGQSHPFHASFCALFLASGVLFGFAFEGLFCLVLALPLAAIVVMLGAGFGILLADWRAPGRSVASIVTLLPLMLAAEVARPPLAEFADSASVEVAAPPAAVWDAIIHMGAIRDAPAAPFGWGLAFPVAGRIDGEGVGAVRLGVFSTGTAYERVTRWEPARALWFNVLSDPPMMHESNPFGPVRAPHLEGYFSTAIARFTIIPLGNGHSRLTLSTEHSLRLGPTHYFLPLARWAVSENKRRVLAHFKAQAEARQRP